MLEAAGLRAAPGRPVPLAQRGLPHAWTTSSSASTPSGATSSSASCAPRPSRASAAHPARRRPGRGGRGDVYRLYASTVDKYPWGAALPHPGLLRADARPLPAPRRVGGGAAGKAGWWPARSTSLARDVLYGRYWGCFEEHPFLHFNVCLYHPVEEAHRAGGWYRFEPGAGGEHKLTRGFEPQPHLQCAPALPPRAGPRGARLPGPRAGRHRRRPAAVAGGDRFQGGAEESAARDVLREPDTAMAQKHEHDTDVVTETKQRAEAQEAAALQGAASTTTTTRRGSSWWRC